MTSLDRDPALDILAERLASDPDQIEIHTYLVNQSLAATMCEQDGRADWQALVLASITEANAIDGFVFNADRIVALAQEGADRMAAAVVAYNDNETAGAELEPGQTYDDLRADAERRQTIYEAIRDNPEGLPNGS